MQLCLLKNIDLVDKISNQQETSTKVSNSSGSTLVEQMKILEQNIIQNGFRDLTGHLEY